jgi:rRNA maturation endonuclease Nob1
MSSGRDLREQMNSDAVAEAFGFLVSGKKGYKTVIERKVEPLKCFSCNIVLQEGVKFCSECGAKVEVRR